MHSIASPEFLADRYGFYRRLHAEAPVHYDEGIRAFLVARYDDVIAAFRAPQLSSRRVDSLTRSWNDDERARMRPLTDSLAFWMLFQDPPDHGRLRALMTRAFTPRVVESLRPRVQALVDRVLDVAGEKGGLDVIADLAFPLPATVILEMLGIPVADRDRFKAWSGDIAKLLGGFGTREAAARASVSLEEMRAYFAPLFAARRAKPEDDLISALLAATDRSEVLDDDELLANCVMLMFGGHETTTNLIGNGALLLLQHGAERERFALDPAITASAIEEILRYEAPVQTMRRTAAEPLAIGGVNIPAGALVVLLLGAANRDSARCPDPDRFDIGRKPRHASFGFGAHFCVGAALARLEGEIALGSLFRRFPRLRIAPDTEVSWQPSVALRALASLPVLT